MTELSTEEKRLQQHEVTEGIVAGYACEKIYAVWLPKGANGKDLSDQLAYVSDGKHILEPVVCQRMIDNKGIRTRSFDHGYSRFQEIAVDKIIGKAGTMFIIGLGRQNFVDGDQYRKLENTLA